MVECIKRTWSKLDSVLSNMNQPMTPNNAAHRSRGPALPPQTAEMRYNNGRSSPPNLDTKSRLSASTMKAPINSIRGKIWATNVTCLNIFLSAGILSIDHNILTAIASPVKIFPKRGRIESPSVILCS